MLCRKPLAFIAGLSLSCSAISANLSTHGLSNAEAASAVIKPFVGAASLRGNVDLFMEITKNVAHDVAHPSEPEMFGAQPGFIRVLEALQSTTDQLSDTCELAGSYRIDRMYGSDAMDDFEDTDSNHGSTGGLYVMRLTYEGCRINHYGQKTQLNGDITFYLVGQPVEGQIAVRGVQFGSHRLGSSATAYTSTVFNDETQAVETVDYRSYGVFGAIPSTLDEQLGFLSGSLKIGIRGEVRTEFKYRINNDVYDGRSSTTAQNVFLDGTYNLGMRVNPTTGASERAATKAVNMLAGVFHGSFDAVVANQTNSFQSLGMRIEDVEFIDSDSGSHYVSFDGLGIVSNSNAAPTCNLGTFYVDTKRPLYFSSYNFDPLGGSLVVDHKVRADFHDDASVVLTANGQPTDYADFNEVRQTAQCFIY